MRQSKWWRNTFSLTTAQRARFKLTRSLRSLFWNQLDLPKKKRIKKRKTFSGKGCEMHRPRNSAISIKNKKKPKNNSYLASFLLCMRDIEVLFLLLQIWNKILAALNVQNVKSLAACFHTKRTCLVYVHTYQYL